MVAGRHAEPLTEPCRARGSRARNPTDLPAQYKLRILVEYERRDRDGKGALLLHPHLAHWQLRRVLFRYPRGLAERPRNALRASSVGPSLESGVTRLTEPWFF